MSIRRRRIRGKWGGLNAKFIADMLDETYITTKRQLYKLKDKLNRYPTVKELGLFITQEINKNELKEIKRFII